MDDLLHKSADFIQGARLDALLRMVATASLKLGFRMTGKYRLKALCVALFLLWYFGRGKQGKIACIFDVAV
jgi:hypothetical protein